MTVTEARKLGADRLERSPGPQNRGLADATLLLMHALQCTRTEILAHPERALSKEEEQLYRRLLEERASGRPIQHITGEQEFFGLSFIVTPDVLIPRPETEHLVEAAIERMRDRAAPRIVDVGTGSGAIAVALAHALPQAQITATDISQEALVIARQNAVQNKVAERIRWMQGDLLADLLNEKFDAVVSNPPYVAETEGPTLPSEVRDHEPPTALFAGPTGLEIYERLVPQAQRVLVPGGWLLMEIGHGQQDAVAHMLHGWDAVGFVPDLQSIPRVVVARKA
jgi:release factor glutamine methyltransferase